MPIASVVGLKRTLFALAVVVITFEAQKYTAHPVDGDTMLALELC